MAGTGETNNKIHVLMIGPDRSVHGGISAVVNNYYEAGLNKKVELDYIGTMKEGSKVYKLLVAAKAYAEFGHKLKWADVVHVNVASDNSFRRKIYFIKKAKRYGKKVIIHQHGGEWNDYYNSLSLKRKGQTCSVLKSADKFLVLSPYYKEFFEKTVGIDDITVFPDTLKIPDKPVKTHGTGRILFLGRLCREKGVAELIEAVIRLHKEYSGIELRLGGIWEDESLSKTIVPYDFINYLGWLDKDKKTRELMDTDIFVMPSYFEGQSLAILEAMTMNCAVVATNVGGIPMMIEDGRTGILVEPKNVDSLYTGIKKVLDDKTLSVKLADEAYDKAKTEFSIDNTINTLIGFYEELVHA